MLAAKCCVPFGRLAAFRFECTNSLLLMTRAMSRIGKKPISIPDGVSVAIDGGEVTVKGKNGEMSWRYHPNMTVTYDEQAKHVCVTRPDDQSQNRALHGLTRSLINNMVEGATTYFVKRLQIVGVGYSAILDGQKLHLQVGFANTVVLPIPNDVICEAPDTTHVIVKSMNKQAVGQFAADIRAVRPPEPYKGKGVRYLGEHIRRKAGKAFASGG